MSLFPIKDDIVLAMIHNIEDWAMCDMEPMLARSLIPVKGMTFYPNSLHKEMIDGQQE